LDITYAHILFLNDAPQAVYASEDNEPSEALFEKLMEQRSKHFLAHKHEYKSEGDYDHIAFWHYHTLKLEYERSS
jgi:hypothetical protein